MFWREILIVYSKSSKNVVERIFSVPVHVVIKPFQTFLLSCTFSVYCMSTSSVMFSSWFIFLQLIRNGTFGGYIVIWSWRITFVVIDICHWTRICKDIHETETINSQKTSFIMRYNTELELEPLAFLSCVKFF